MREKKCQQICETCIKIINSYGDKNVIMHEIYIIQITIFVNKKSQICLTDIKIINEVRRRKLSNIRSKHNLDESVRDVLRIVQKVNQNYNKIEIDDNNYDCFHWNELS